MKKAGIVAVFSAAFLLQACAASTPQQQRQNECIGTTAAGALAGGAIGSLFGGGTGQTIMTAGGAIVGAQAAQNASGC